MSECTYRSIKFPGDFVQELHKKKIVIRQTTTQRKKVRTFNVSFRFAFTQSITYILIMKVLSAMYVQ